MEDHRLTRWLTLGANIAVVAGIVLLLMELDQNRQQMRAQTRHELAMGIVDLLQTLATNEQLANVFYRARAGEPLTPVEQFQFEVRTNALFRYWEDVHYQYRLGLYDEVEFERQRGAWKASLGSSRLAIEYWCRVRTLYSPEFAAEMDGLLDTACTSRTASMDSAGVKTFADRYTAAWNSRIPANVAGFFETDGTLFVNGTPATGREAIEGVARDFMTAFPDLELVMDGLEFATDTVKYHWTFIGTNTGPGGTGNAVRFSGYEEWTLGSDGLIVQSQGRFDSDEYQRQLQHGSTSDDG